MGLILDNPIAYVQVQLRGGWKSLVIQPAVYLLIMGSIIAAWMRSDDRHITSVAEGWTTVLMLIQGLLALGLAPARVAASVRADTASGIIESHRLMPVTGLTACVGYMLGPIAQFLLIGLVTFGMGLMTTSLAGLNPDRWVVNNLIMLVFLCFACTWSVLTGFLPRGIFSLTVGLAIFSTFSRGLILYAVPAAAMLFLPLARDTVFAQRSSLDLFGASVAESFLAQGLMGLIFMTAAARRFRSPQIPAFTVRLALALLAAWVVLNLLGTYQWADFEPGMFRHGLGDDSQRACVQFVGSALTAILICVLPLSAAARSMRESTEVSSGGGIGGLVATALVCAFLVGCLLIIPFLGARHPVPGLLFAATGIGCAIISLAALVCFTRDKPRSIPWQLIIFLFVTWILPLLADVVVHSLIYDSDNSAPWRISEISPIGTLLCPWYPNMQTVAGPGCQITITFLMLLRALWTQRRRTRRIPPPLPIPSVAVGAE
jgi:hypothetical protein